jgi:uncharacterized membrane protein
MSADNARATCTRASMAILVLFSCSLLVSIFSPTFVLAQKSKTPASTASTFTANLVNIEAAVHETFRYTAMLHNGSAQGRVYALKAALPIGWGVVFRARGSQVTAINIDAGKDQDISIEIQPAFAAAPATYKIPVLATAEHDSLTLNLEAVVKGSFGIELTTPSGRLSDAITEGKQKEIHLVVRNTGTLPLKDIALSAQTPSKWDVTFTPAKIDELAPEKTIDVVARVSVPDKTIAGDYVTLFTAKNANREGQASFRMTVKTSVLSGWIGILIILAAICLVVYLIRKYGRR